MFRHKRYLFLALGCTLVFFMLEVVLANLAVVTFAFKTPLLNWRNKVDALVNSVDVFLNVLSLSSQVIAGVLAFLVGIQLSLLVYYFKTRSFATTVASTSLAGAVLSILGAGCVSCGPVILAALLGFATSVRILTFLPFRGQEFGFVAVVIMLGSVFVVLRKITTPHVCRVKMRSMH